MALSYIGGKSRIGKWINEFYPKDMETYVETFGGMFWCFFNMDLKKFPNLKEVVYNDFNPLNYNLFRCIQNPSELLKAVNNIPCQQRGESVTPLIYKEQFDTFQKELYASGFTVNYPDYEVAAKYAYILTSIFSGSKPESSGFIDLKGNYKSKFLTFRDKFELLHTWFPESEYTWKMKEFAKAASAKKGVTQNMGQELLIMNY